MALEKYIEEKKFAAKTVDALRHAVKLLEDWSEQEGLGAYVGSIDTREREISRQTGL